MSNNNKNKLVPKLRFPEFVNSGEWEVKKLGELLYAENSTLTFNKLEFKENGYPVYGADSIVGCIDEFQHKEQYISIVKDGSGVGRLCLCNPKSSILGTLTALKLKDKTKFHLLCVYYLLNTLDFSSYTKGSGIPHIYYSDYKEHKIPIPSLPEQQKIAACLSSLDDLITAESQKLEWYLQHKKGLLQNLFPQSRLNRDSSDSYDEHDSKNQGNQENQKNHSPDNVPKLRFPEFVNSGAWEVKRLGEVYYFLTTNSFSRENLNYEKGIVKNIHYGDIHTKFSTLFDITKEEVPFVNTDVQINKIKEGSYCQEGDIIFADTSEDLNDIGKSIEIINLNGEKLVAGLHTLLARQINKEIIIGFGGYLFKSSQIRKQIQKESQGAKVLGISANRISNIKIVYPKNQTEQQKIAACLSSLDDLIDAQRQKIEWLQQHKKGLLQGLFPDLITN